jgi:hypothetical protein
MTQRAGLDRIGWVLVALAVVSLGNGAWMLADPLRWYEDLPAGVPDTGPFNAHFVRDIGCAFLAVGAGLAVAARRVEWRVPLVGVAAVFYMAHAVLHVADTVGGALDADHWLLDLPGVYFLAALLVWLTVRVSRHPSLP